MFRKMRAGLLALAFKLGPKLFSAISALVKGLKVGKVGLAASSMALYAYIFTWQFAVLIMVSLFVHESGHVWAMKRCGIKTRGIYFIPFVGGAAVADEMFPTRASESFIALMGPIWGLALALVTVIGYFIIGNPLLAVAASWMAMVNLFNLLPVSPLDGGRVFKSIAFSLRSWAGIWYMIIGLVLATAAAFMSGIFLFGLLVVVGAIDLLAERMRSEDLPKMYGEQIATSISVYLALVVSLWLLMTYTAHIPGADIARSVFMA